MPLKQTDPRLPPSFASLSEALKRSRRRSYPPQDFGVGASRGFCGALRDTLRDSYQVSIKGLGFGGLVFRGLGFRGLGV